MRCRLFTWMIGFSLLFSICTDVSGMEKLDRGLVALEREDGSVFLSWRLLETDPEDIAFQLIRRSIQSTDSQSELLTKPSPYHLTNFVDKIPEKDAGRKTYVYELRTYLHPKSSDSPRRLGRVSITLSGKAKPYISIPLKGDYDFQKVGIADLDGDGSYEFVIKQPNFNTDPYQRPGYWKKSPTTYKTNN